MRLCITGRCLVCRRGVWGICVTCSALLMANLSFCRPASVSDLVAVISYVCILEGASWRIAFAASLLHVLDDWIVWLGKCLGVWFSLWFGVRLGVWV